jgi:hypothetical protein
MQSIYLTLIVFEIWTCRLKFLSAWRDELGRLRIWASDVGVYQTQGGLASLDGLLNKFPTVKSQVLRQLTRIQRLLGDLADELRNAGRKDSDNDSESKKSRRTKTTMVTTRRNN